MTRVYGRRGPFDFLIAANFCINLQMGKTHVRQMNKAPDKLRSVVSLLSFEEPQSVDIC